MKKSNTTTPSQIKVGDIVHFLEIPYKKEDSRMYWKPEKVKEFIFTKSQKRVTVVFESGLRIGTIAMASTLTTISKKLLAELTEELGFRNAPTTK